MAAEPVDYRSFGPLYAGWARGLSMLAALVLSGMLLVMPHLVAVEIRDIDHGQLSLGLLGVCAGFVHGIGFVPESRWWRILFGPWVAWPLMILLAVSWLS
jgi:cyd operon protein YbgE